MPVDEIIPIQAVWQMLGQKEWALQMKDMQLAQAQQEIATLRQRLVEAMAELAALQEQHTEALLRLAALQECAEAQKAMGDSRDKHDDVER